MLIRWATENDLPAWYKLATEVSAIFQHPADMGAELRQNKKGTGSVGRHEMLTAVDYMSGNNMGFILFSREKNSITWFAVSEKHRGKGAGDRLLKTALRQLDTNKNMTVCTFCDDYPQGTAARALYRKHDFTEEKLIEHNGLPRSEMTRPATNEKRGKSFHYRYPKFIKEAEKEHCPVCRNEPAPDGQNDIEVSDTVWICGEYPGQGRLFGKMYVMPRNHAFHFEDMPESDMAEFMSEVQRVGKALRKVTGAEKINYEMHSNSGAHLHTHLCPRYLDDDFPGKAIDLSCPSDPIPYESFEEYLWFIEQMRKELADNI
ncbi:MAG: GNAT family N-acetyltransferase [Oscillospiraceae bacterium]|nr:GNAT family N-acetyltransferase [Oscillospiraceae bacterium]